MSRLFFIEKDCFINCDNYAKFSVHTSCRGGYNIMDGMIQKPLIEA